MLHGPACRPTRCHPLSLGPGGFHGPGLRITGIAPCAIFLPFKGAGAYRLGRGAGAQLGSRPAPGQVTLRQFRAFRMAFPGHQLAIDKGPIVHY